MSDDESRNIEQHLNYACVLIVIFNTRLFDFRKNEKNKESFIFEVDLKYSPEQHERDVEYSLALEIMTIEHEIA